MSDDAYSQLILIPGLLEPGFSFMPLTHMLRKHGVPVERWRDRLIFRSLADSVNQLADAIAGDADAIGSIGIVTHSFGDWVARAAIAKSQQHRVRAMVSLAPVMRAGFLPSLLYVLTGNIVPEIEIIMDREKASANLGCDDRIRRLVVWSRFDESLRSVPLDHIANLDVQRVYGTHFSMAWQPNTIRLVNRFLFRDSLSCHQTFSGT